MMPRLLDRNNLRLQITLVLSLAAHFLLLALFGSRQFQPETKTIKLTEVQFQEEISKPTEIEKLMTKLSAAKPTKTASPKAAAEDAAISMLQKESFKQIVGLPKSKPMDEIAATDLTKLAKLPSLEKMLKTEVPGLAKPAANNIALVRSPISEQAALESKIVPLEGLPAADFGPALSNREFQQPELIIKKVKAERRENQPSETKRKSLSLKSDEFISGEVKNRELLHREFPVVPRWLEEKGIEAEVVIRFVVNPDGEVGDQLVIEKTSGYAELDRLAREALKKFQFAPLPLTVKQVEQSGTIVMRFTLKGQ